MDEIYEDEESQDDGKFRHVMLGHSSLSTVKDFIEKSKTSALKTVILCHLSSTNADPEEMYRQIKMVVGKKTKVYIAEKGMVIDI